jgi:hypothetical protein
LTISSRILFAIGLGLFVDELTFLATRGRTHQDNYSAKSLVGTILIMALVYVFRENVFIF